MVSVNTLLQWLLHYTLQLCLLCLFTLDLNYVFAVEITFHLDLAPLGTTTVLVTVIREADLPLKKDFVRCSGS